jgi:hypothetical protein
MRILKGPRVLAAAGAALGTLLLGGGANAQTSFTIEQPSSVLIFPKVVNEGGTGRDTVIQITNSLNAPAHAKCFYTDGRTIGGQPLWLTTDFSISLTRQQPTTWRASTGRPVNPGDAQNGLDPGAVPPLTPGFMGSLVCVQVDQPQGGAPWGGNALMGRAEVGGSEYNAIGVPAVGDVNTDNVIDMNGIEYAACPNGYYLNFAHEGSSGALALGQMMAGQGLNDVPATVSTNLTVVPCDMNFASARPNTLTVNANPIFDEMETASSGATAAITCWDSFSLSDPQVASGFNIPTAFGTAQLTSTEGFVVVANVLRTGGTTAAQDSAATNLHTTGSTVPGQIRLP